MMDIISETKNDKNFSELLDVMNDVEQSDDIDDIRNEFNDMDIFNREFNENIDSKIDSNEYELNIK